MLAAASSVHAVRWANAFVERGHEVHLVTQHPPDDSLSVYVEVHRFPHRRGLGYIWNGTRLKQLVHQLIPDVVNAHYGTGYGTLSLAVQQVPVVLNVWGSDVYEFPDKGRLHHKWLLRNLKHADQLVSTSEAMAARTREVGGRKLLITVIPFGVDTEVFHPAIIPAQRKDKIVIGTVKSLAHVYGIDILIRAFAQVAKKLPELKLRLVIIGHGPQERELRRLAQELDVYRKVTFKGAIAHSQVPQALRGMDIFCALSRNESFGVAVVEASATGLPVIVTRVGGLPEVVEDKVTGLIVPPEDEQAAANAIEQLVLSPEQSDVMGAAGRRFVEKHYAWEHSVDRMLCVLERSAKRGER